MKAAKFSISARILSVWAPIRGEEFHSEVYDGEQLGVKTCDNGELIGGGIFCKITLVKGESPGFKTKAEAERAAREEAEREAARVETVVEPVAADDEDKDDE